MRFLRRHDRRPADAPLRPLPHLGGFALLNPIAGDSMSSSAMIIGLAVNPVADLGDFGLCGTIGEVVYVSVSDDASSFKTRILVFAFTDSTGVAPAGAIQILRNSLSHVQRASPGESLERLSKYSVSKSGRSTYGESARYLTFHASQTRDGIPAPDLPFGNHGRVSKARGWLLP